MSGIARKRTIPNYLVTELCDCNDLEATKITLPSGTSYFCRPKNIGGINSHIDQFASRHRSTIQTFPIVLRADGAPWDEANLYIFNKFRQAFAPDMCSISGLADDLTAYCRFLEDVSLNESAIDWMHFPPHQNAKPTFRYRGYLTQKIWAGELKRSTAKRRMGSVIRFYRWLIDSELLRPENAPWRDHEKLISIPSAYGQTKLMSVTTTDLRIPIAEQDDPYSGLLDDGGKLRPLSPREQAWVIDALQACGNTEMMLIHAFALLTGARIQTVLTVKVKHVLAPVGRDITTSVWNIGPGTGIDTKNNKQLRLHVPVWFYNSLRTYALSDRARKRRHLALGGDIEDQYLFLSNRNAPMYLSKQDKQYAVSRPLRHRIAGQGVRQYIREFIIPYIKGKYDPNFHYRFHDLRASYGMNMVDHLAPLLAAGEISYTEVLNFVGSRLGHGSLVVTEKYLKFGTQRKIIRRIQDEWETHVMKMVYRGMGVNSNEA